MSKTEKKRRDSKEKLKVLKNKINEIDKSKEKQVEHQSCLSVLISKLFKKTN